MRGLTVKFPEATLRRLKQEARVTGRTVADLVREQVTRRPDRPGPVSVHDLAADLAGSLAGSRRPASNARRRFRRR